MVFYARWFDLSTPKYTVTFHANGANGTPPAPRTVYSGVSITLPSREYLAYTNKNFAGWNTLATGQGTGYTAGAALTVTGNVDLYAKWLSEVTYTVTFNANGASGTAPASITEDPGTVINLPGQGSMTNIGKTFEGWNTNAGGTGTSYEAGDSYTVNADITFYARWLSVPITPPGATLVEQLAYIRNNAGDGVVYNIVVNNNEYIGPQTVSTMGRNIMVNISSASPADIKTIQLEGQGHLFSVDTGITLKLQDIILQGHSNNNKALVAVGNGTLILNSGAKITQNTNISDPANGGGVYVNGSTLEINEGSEITGNIAYENGWRGHPHGGGIFIENRGIVNIRGGLISENTADNSASQGVAAYGGGIYVTGNSTVTMSGGIISKNKFIGNLYERRGGGIFVDNGSSFTKRAVPSGSSPSGIIYGGSGSDANIADIGHAIYRNWGSKRQCNTTLNGYDEISTGNDVGWE
jgi:hypothetical protein